VSTVYNLTQMTCTFLVPRYNIQRYARKINGRILGQLLKKTERARPDRRS
jgi:hypothetical protein